MSVEITFEQARKDDSLRQKYLDGIPLGELMKYVRHVKYVPQNNERYFMGTVNDLSMFGVRKTKSNIIVTPDAFCIPETEEDFLSFLIDHEGQHARDNFINKFPPILMGLADIRARCMKLLGVVVTHCGLPSCVKSSGNMRKCFHGDRVRALEERRAYHTQHKLDASKRRSLSTSLKQRLEKKRNKFRQKSKKCLHIQLSATASWDNDGELKPL